MPAYVKTQSLQPQHGGNLAKALSVFGGKASEWLDLSSALNADAWPVPPIPAAHWQHLPQRSATWSTCCQRYYGHEGLLTAGSQAVIMALPRIVQSCRVWMLSGSYGEHAHHWRLAGHQVIEWSVSELASALQQYPSEHLPDVLLLVNPDNPSGQRYPLAQLRQWQQRLQQRQGLLVLDEAFIDTEPEHSWLAQNEAFAGTRAVIVLRSFGKFFGLAGARLGVVFASAAYRQALAAALGPWPVSGASQWLAEQALDDFEWQQQQRLRLAHQQARSRRVFARCSLLTVQPLFVTLSHADVMRWHQAFAERRIWTRVFAQQQRLRLGLPNKEQDWQRLQTAVEEIQAL